MSVHEAHEWRPWRPTHAQSEGQSPHSWYTDAAQGMSKENMSNHLK
uniref:Uncharacterized protein n=1 Tax=Arundo donax TaxID=35708 RepID=A0A0A8Y7W5_ARUDO